MRTDTPLPSEHQDRLIHNSLVPRHRRARVIFAMVFFFLSLFFLTYVSSL